MKCIILLALYVSCLQAQPYLGRLGLGMGLGRTGGGFFNGGGYGRNLFNGGASGLSNAGYGSSGAGGYHNLGGHRNRVTSINTADNSGFHNIGGGGALNNGGYEGNGFNDYRNGANNYGSGFGAGGGGGGFFV